MSDPISRLNTALEGRYRIERQLGEGGMATVYLADDLKHERKVALKVLKPELAAVIGADRFLAEIKTTANLQHPHILPLHDSGEADGLLFYVMPYVEGESLRERLDRDHQLGVDEALGIATKVGAALQAAHERGVIHRDIKPANILLSKGEPLISDFGIALAVSAGGAGRLTETGLSLGTPHYMSPEQATGAQTVGVGTDIYALGCVLYEMLVGEPPYTGSTPQAILGKIIQAKPVSATEVRQTVPAHVDAVIRKALEKVPADRFRSASEFVSRLGDKGFRHGHAVEAPAVTSGPAARPGPWIRDTRSVAVATLAAVMTLAFAWTLLRPPPPDGVEPVRRFEIDLPEGVILRGVTYQPLAISRDGSFVVVNGRTAEGDQLYRRDLDRLEMTPIRGTEGVGSFAVSPDGQWVAFNNISTQELVKVPVDGGPATTLAPTPGTATVIGGFTWTAGGWIVYSFGSYAGLQRVRDVGGEFEPLTAPPEGARHTSPSPMPDGETILFEIERPDGDSEIAIVRPGTGEYDVLTWGSDPEYVPGDFVLLRRGDALWAAPLAADWRSLTSEPFPVVENVGGTYDYFSVAADGTLFHLLGGANSGDGARLAVLDLDGNLDVLPLGPRSFTLVGPSWSPDGESVVFGSGGQIYTYNTVLNTTPRQITFEGVNNNPVYSPDGTRIAFSSQRDGTEAFDLFVKDLTLDAPPRLLLALEGIQVPTGWASDTLLVFEGSSAAGEQLGMLDISDPDNPEARGYLTSETDLSTITVSPDARHAAYGSDESGETEVYIRSFPDPGVQTLVSRGGARYPFWSPDGNTLYYYTGFGGPWVAARLERDPVLSVVALDTLFAREALANPPASPSFHPDGDRWIVALAASMSTDEGAPAQRRVLVLVQNFHEELRRLTAN
jgi:Tol biopolymer transport system component